MPEQYWTRVRGVVDALVVSDRPITQEVLNKAAVNLGTAFRTTGFEGVKNVTVSFHPNHRYAVCHIHDAVDTRCAYCRSHSMDELGTEYTE